MNRRADTIGERAEKVRHEFRRHRPDLLATETTLKHRESAAR
jgi:hypothetical protein